MSSSTMSSPARRRRRRRAGRRGDGTPSRLRSAIEPRSTTSSTPAPGSPSTCSWRSNIFVKNAGDLGVGACGRPRRGCGRDTCPGCGRCSSARSGAAARRRCRRSARRRRSRRRRRPRRGSGRRRRCRCRARCRCPRGTRSRARRRRRRRRGTPRSPGPTRSRAPVSMRPFARNSSICSPSSSSTPCSR